VAQLAKILSLAAYRTRSTGATASHAMEVDPGPRERRARFVVIGLLLAALGVPALGHLVDAAEISEAAPALPAPIRARLYEHAIDELQAICPQPIAAAGVLRQHCADQARLVLSLPECDDACRRAVATVLPRAPR